MRKHLLRIVELLALALIIWSCNFFAVEDQDSVMTFSPESSIIDYQSQTLVVSLHCPKCKHSEVDNHFFVNADGKVYYDSYDEIKVNTNQNTVFNDVDASVPRYINGPWFTVEIPASPGETLRVEIAENDTGSQRSLEICGWWHLGECTITQEAHPAEGNS